MEQVYLESKMNLYPEQSVDKKTDLQIFLAVLSICLCAGCGFTLSSMFGDIISNQAGVICFALLPLVLSMIMNSRMAFKTDILVAIAVMLSAVLVEIFFLTETHQRIFLSVMAVVIFLVSLGIRLSDKRLCLFSTLIPIVFGIMVGNVPDIWYLGVMILSWCGVIAGLYSEKEMFVGKKTVNLKMQDSDYKIWILILVMILILLYGILFTPKVFYGTSWLQYLHTQTAGLMQSANHHIDKIAGSHSISQSVSFEGSNRTGSTSQFWIGHVIGMFILVIVIMIAGYEMIKRIRLRQRIRRFQTVVDEPTAYDMYRYLVQLFYFVKADISAGSDTRTDVLISKYENNDSSKDNNPDSENTKFSDILQYIYRLRYGKKGLTASEHKAMADYCMRIRSAIYRRLNRREKFRFRYMKVYI